MIAHHQLKLVSTFDAHIAESALTLTLTHSLSLSWYRSLPLCLGRLLSFGWHALKMEALSACRLARTHGELKQAGNSCGALPDCAAYDDIKRKEKMNVVCLEGGVAIAFDTRCLAKMSYKLLEKRAIIAIIMECRVQLSSRTGS